MPKKEKHIHPDLYKRIIRAKDFIDDCYSDSINIERIAKEAHISPYHFIRVFHKIYNKTPHQYLTRRRIDKAKELLSRDSSITNVCFDVGFESPGSFSTLFSKHVGYPPAVYRKEHRRKMMLSVCFPEKLIPYCFLLQNRMP
jgi:AraC-like DNA-binding protein